MRSMGAITPQQVALHQAAQAAKKPVTRGKGSMGRTRIPRATKPKAPPGVTYGEAVDGEMSPAAAASLKQLMKESLKPGPFKPCAYHEAKGMNDLHVILQDRPSVAEGSEVCSVGVASDRQTVVSFRVHLPPLGLDPEAKRVRVDTLLRKMAELAKEYSTVDQIWVLRAHIAWLETRAAPQYITLKQVSQFG